MKIAIPDEIAWLNEVALDNLKNYQIWHHRHLLINEYYPSIESSPEEIAKLAASETAFLTTMFAEDTKNYHVWSYRSFLVRKLGMWNAAELQSTATMISEDVRNNSAWSHRFYIVFSDPAHSTPGSAATEPDPAVPSDIIDREIRYAHDMIYLAPQNQSPWNYLKGVLVKGGRKLASVEGFVREFISNLGDDEKEDVKSSHALDLLADICAEKGDNKEAELCLTRLSDKWDRIRAGYWSWKKQQLSDNSK
jgi:protein farnesyltransferase/geranylgeranyltransferase type-1 subunit alpha